MTLYIIKDPQGKMVSDACADTYNAWASCKHGTGKAKWNSGDGYTDVMQRLGYRITPVSVYDPETQVVVDKVAHEHLASFLIHELGCHENDYPDCVNQFLSAGKEKTYEP